MIAELIAETPAWLASNGLLALEIGQGQANRVRALVDSTESYGEVELRRDLAGIERVVLASRQGPAHSGG